MFPGLIFVSEYNTIQYNIYIYIYIYIYISILFELRYLYLISTDLNIEDEKSIVDILIILLALISSLIR